MSPTNFPFPTWSTVPWVMLIVLPLGIVGWLAYTYDPAEPIQPQPVPDAAANRDPQSDAPTATPQLPPRTITDRNFFDAAINGEMVTIQSGLRQGIDPDIVDPDGQTALMMAGFSGHLNVMRRLIDEGADVNHVSALNHRTALMLTSSGPHVEAVRLLLHEGAEVNVQDSHEGWTALMMAAYGGQAEVVEILLAAGAEKSLVDTDGDTALSFAQQGQHATVVKLLSE